MKELSVNMLKEFVSDYCDEPFKNISLNNWYDWKWQIKNRITDYEKLCDLLGMPTNNKYHIRNIIRRYIFGITPYTAKLMYHYLSSAKIKEFETLWKIYVPQVEEDYSQSLYHNFVSGTGEEITSPSKNCFQFFPDRILIRVNSFCPSICRYCYIRHKIGIQGYILGKNEINRIAKNVQSDKKIRDVIISGGDPLLISDDHLAFILKTFRKIPHINLLRIDTKVPNSLPQRITPALVKRLSRYSPVFINTHIVHPCEITDSVRRACNLLANNGIVLGAHIPLLRGVNDSPKIIKKLVIELLKLRIRPYMLIHFIKTDGADHFATSVEKGSEIIKYLWGNVSGLAVPEYVLYLPNGGGKIPISPNYVVKVEGNVLILRNYQGKTCKYEIPKV